MVEALLSEGLNEGKSLGGGGGRVKDAVSVSPANQLVSSVLSTHTFIEPLLCSKFWVSANRLRYIPALNEEASEKSSVKELKEI